MTDLTYSIQVLEAAFAKVVKFAIMCLHPIFRIFKFFSKIDDGVFRMECDGREMIFPQDFNPEVDWYMV